MPKKHEYKGCVPIGPDVRKDSTEINIRVWINHPRRGDVMVELVSPNGVKSVLAETCSLDEVHNYQTLVRIVYDFLVVYQHFLI